MFSVWILPHILDENKQDINACNGSEPTRLSLVHLNKNVGNNNLEE